MINGLVDENDSAEPTSDSCLKNCVPSNDEELSQLFDAKSLSGTQPAILSIVEPFSDNFVPRFSQNTFPKPLTSLHDMTYMQSEYHELLEVCESVSLQCTAEMSQLKKGRPDPRPNLLCGINTENGRVTASCMKSVCHANAANPAQSLVKSICYP